MPTYSISAPDGNTYQIDGPAGASQQDVQAEVMRQHPNAGAAPPPSGNPLTDPAAASTLQSRLQAPATGVNHAIAATLGMPVDAGTSVVNLGRTLMGQPRIPLAGQTGGGDWFEDQLNKMGVQTRPDNPNDPVQRYGAAAGTVLPALASGNLTTGMRALAGAFGQQFLADAGAPEWAQTAAGVAGNKTGLSDLTRVGAATALTKVEASAAPRVQADLANAQATSPNMQTVAQSTGKPLIAKLGQGAAGATTQEASARIVDQLAGGMTDQAKAIAPLGVSNPEVAGKVQQVLQQKDSDLSSRADAVYNSGRSAVAKTPGVVQTPNTVAAVDQMLAMGADPKNLAPPVVTARLQALTNTLRPTPAPAPGMEAMGGTPPMSPGGTSWGGFYDLRKQINTLFDEVPQDSITPAMNATFAKLKQGYYADLSAAPDSPAKDITTKANQIYSGLQDERETLKNSVVASVLGKDGKTSISDPDQVLNRLVGLQPSAQTYVRNILETYSPQTLDQLRSYAITKNVADAARTGAGATVAQVEPRSLTPGKLANSGLFTDAQADELNSRESALRTALTALPEKGAPVAEVTPQSLGRLAGGGFSPTFLGGTALNMLSAGTLEKALNTPEGRNKILANTTSKSQDVQTAVKAYQAALMAQVAQDRKGAQQRSASAPVGAQAAPSGIPGGNPVPGPQPPVGP